MEYLTRKQLVLIIAGLFAVFVSCQTIFFVIPHFNETDGGDSSSQTSVKATVKPSPIPTATPKPKKQHKLVEEFGCQWILDTYRPMSDLGRDIAIMHLSNEMNLKRGVSLTSHVGTGDAAEALRECER